MTADRMPYVDYISPAYMTEAFFVFRPPPLSFTANIYTLPFSGLVWSVHGGLVIFISICLYIALIWEREKGDKKHVS